MSVWLDLEGPEEDAVWKRFDEKFDFNPSVDPKDWPGIREPTESVTFGIGHVYDLGAEFYECRTLDLCVKLMKAFRQCFGRGEMVYVLDWQHACYRFDPHGEFEFTSEDDWPVPALPNGDYYIFLAQDMESGVFGHPWEQTMCVFGRRLIDALREDPPELFVNKVRVGGQVV